MNQSTIIGFLGKDPEVKVLPNGTPVLRLSVATQKSWKDKNNEWQEKTQWHTVSAYGEGYERLATRLAKGSHVFVQGELTTREYEQTMEVPNGKKHITTTVKRMAVEIKADTVKLLDRNTNAAVEVGSDEHLPEEEAL